MANDTKEQDMAHVIACELAAIDGYDPDDERGGLYDVCWTGGATPEPAGDLFSLEYLPKGERIAAALGNDTNTGAAAPQDERERFEIAVKAQMGITPVRELNGSGYLSPSIDSMYDGWTLARAQTIPLAAFPTDVLGALDSVDDFIARVNGDDRGSCEAVNLLRRALAALPAQAVAPANADQSQRSKAALDATYDPDYMAGLDSAGHLVISDCVPCGGHVDMPDGSSEWRDAAYWEISATSKSHAPTGAKFRRVRRGEPQALAAPVDIATEADAPAEFQVRRIVGTLGDEPSWSEWEKCSAEQAAAYEQNSDQCDWRYEVRRLYALAAPVQDVAPSARELDMAMLIRRIVISARRNCEDGSNVLKLANSAAYYLRRSGLDGSPLRDSGIESDPAVAKDVAPSDARECLQDIISHYADFKTALDHMESGIQLADNRAYWKKQIAVLGRMRDQAARALAAQPAAQQSGNSGEFAAQPADAQQEYTPVAFVTREEKYDVRGACLCKEGLELPTGTGLYAKTSELEAANAAARTQEGAAS